MYCAKLQKFQNISCYCLTSRSYSSLIQYYKFQNISCYCLTRIIMAKPSKELISKHLMLLFNKGAKMKKKKLGNFKTSHVIV